ncbi:MAG: hypothetical protein ACTSYH_03280 [Candidatus Heimdallarchaeaceae archaeon]
MIRKAAKIISKAVISGKIYDYGNAYTIETDETLVLLGHELRSLSQ